MRGGPSRRCTSSGASSSGCAPPSSTAWRRLGPLAGDAVTAERLLRDGLRTLREFGERGNAASVAADLARALHALGREDEAEAMAVEACELGNPDDVEVQVFSRVARAGAMAA